MASVVAMEMDGVNISNSQMSDVCLQDEPHFIPSNFDVPVTVSVVNSGTERPPTYEDINNPNASPPPSYDSLFGRVRQARQESNGFIEFIKKFIIIILGTVACTIILGLVMALPIANITIGSLFIYDCNAQPYIPVFLIVSGSLGALQILLSCTQKCPNENNGKQTSTCGIFTVFGLGWFIAVVNNKMTSTVDMDDNCKNNWNDVYPDEETKLLPNDVELGTDNPPTYEDANNPNNLLPTYDSLFGKFRQAHKESNGRLLLLMYLVLVSGSVMLGMMLALPIINIAIGLIYMFDCKAQPLIPVYLLVSGASSILFIRLNIREPCAKTTVKNCQYWCSGFLIRFIVLWFLFGFIWVYRIYEPNYEDHDSGHYCNKILYLYSFWSISIIFLFLILTGLFGYFYECFQLLKK
ncbi:hypothetical protein CHUAL_002652 [Chamberlinius hualienensis]